MILFFFIPALFLSNDWTFNDFISFVSIFHGKIDLFLKICLRSTQFRANCSHFSSLLLSFKLVFCSLIVFCIVVTFLNRTIFPMNSFCLLSFSFHFFHIKFTILFQCLCPSLSIKSNELMYHDSEFDRHVSWWYALTPVVKGQSMHFSNLLKKSRISLNRVIISFDPVRWVVCWSAVLLRQQNCLCLQNVFASLLSKIKTVEKNIKKKFRNVLFNAILVLNWLKFFLWNVETNEKQRFQ